MITNTTPSPYQRLYGSYTKDAKHDAYAAARGVLTDYAQTCALVLALEQRDLCHIRYQTKPDSAATVQSYVSTVRYTTPLNHMVVSVAGIILRCASTPIDAPTIPMGRRVCDLFAGGHKRDAITLKIFEVQVSLLDGDFGVRCAINLARMRAIAEQRSPLFKDKRCA